MPISASISIPISISDLYIYIYLSLSYINAKMEPFTTSPLFNGASFSNQVSVAGFKYSHPLVLGGQKFPKLVHYPNNMAIYDPPQTSKTTQKKDPEKWRCLFLC
jgi:hypothetical protein